MAHKSYHQHKKEEIEEALFTLSKAKIFDNDKASIYLKDNSNTIIRVSRSKLKKKIELLNKQGKIIKQIL